MPELTVETVEYQEGIWTYRRKFPGNVTVSDITLTRGAVKKGSNFFQWVKDAAEGKAYRVDFNILAFHRDDVQGLLDYTNAAPSKIIRCYEAFAVRVKPGSDFDSLSSDVSIEELDLAIERFEVEFPK